MAREEYDHILTRLIGILTKLSDGEKVTTKELSEEFSVSVRTIQKDIKDHLKYFDIKRDKQHRLYFAEGTSMAKTNLKNDELMLVSLALSAFKDVSDFDDMADSVLRKLLYPKNFNPYYIKYEDIEDIPISSIMIQEIKAAIRDQNHLKIKGVKGDIIVEPYKIVAYDGIWYLVAKDEFDNKTKTFMINRINDVDTIYNKHKVTQQEVQEIIDKTHSAWYVEGNCYEVKIKVYPNIAIYFKQKDFLQSQKIEQELQDGSLIVTFEVSHDEDIDNIIKSWLPDIEVLEPKRYANKIKKELQDYLKRIN